MHPLEIKGHEQALRRLVGDEFLPVGERQGKIVFFLVTKGRELACREVAAADGALAVPRIQDDPVAEGEELARFHPSEYLDHLAERVEPWTYLKFPYLKKVGWKGLVDGQDSGVYKATPLSRLNAADGMATPMAQEAYDKMFSTLGGKPVHATLATHWARLVEMMYAAERLLELATDPEITSTDIRAIPKATPSEGVGCVEAPRGTLIHHYTTDERGLVRKVNLIVGTTNNNAAICMSLKKAAQKVIRGGAQVSEGLLNLVEMAFRAYDPCLACATHSLPGDMPLVITIHDSSGQVVDTVSRD